VVWGVGVLAYVLTVMQRTTLGVAGLDAAEHLGVSAGALSLFVFVQVSVYMLAQLPAGFLTDRHGARVMLVASATLLAAGQLLLALSTGLPLAVLARVLVGVGDAIVFVAVLALLPRWFPARRVPMITQLTTILCQAGQILSAVPFLALLHAAGWQAAFGSAAAASALVAVLALVVVRDAPGGPPERAPGVSLPEIGRRLREVWGRPGTRVGVFCHMAVQFPMNVFTLLWGVPYLVSAQGLSGAAAGGLITVFVACTIAFGPVVGVLTTWRPLRRSRLVLVVVAVTAATWTAVLALPGRAPLAVLVLLVVVLALGGPASVVGIDIGRTSNPTSSLGVAQALVNLGGFAASLVVLAAMGVVLDLAGGFTPEAFRLAWLVQYPVWAVGVVCLLLARRTARRAEPAAVGGDAQGRSAARRATPAAAGPPTA
jgi:predicted MFS family arabinose efflux permease